MITFDKKTQTFFLDGKSVTYAFFINAAGYAEHLYFGRSIAHDDLRYTRKLGTNCFTSTRPGGDDAPALDSSYGTFPPEISFFGTGDYREPTIMVENVTGDRLVELLYDGYEILQDKPKISGIPSMTGGETLVLHLRDRITQLAADLYYTVYPDCSVIARRIVYRNGGTTRATLRRAYSFALALPGQDYDVMTLFGGWARERQIERRALHHGVISVDSKRTTSSSALNPFIGIMSKETTENYGEIWGVSLVYSSSFVLKAEGVSDGSTVVSGGIQDFDFAWQLAPNATFETPEVVIAYSAEGIGGMSRAFHDAFRDHLINHRFAHTPRPLLINNWEGTYFNFDNQKLMDIVDAVQGTGIDTFVLDDGWFGNRNSDRTGLGDWVVNEKKMEGGLRPVIDHVHAKGMKFGLWFEPEMISEDSDLYRTHPDYAIAAPNRANCHGRHQLMLDLTRADVRDYIVNSVNTILHNNAIDYVKWDYNRNMTESYSFGRAADQQAEFAHRYALGVYDLCERIVEANPTVFFEGCSGGGGRFDPAMLHYFPQIWTSDDSDAEERTWIQYGTSIVYPLSAMSCHVSICPNHQTGRMTPYATRAAIAHLGSTGYELDTTTFSEQDRAETAQQVAEYRRCQDLILNGDLYRIDNPYQGNFFAEAVVSKDRSTAILVAYRRMGRVNNEVHRVRMLGLDPEKRYFVEELNQEIAGSTLMQVGLAPDYPQGDFTVVKYHFVAR